MKQLLLLFIYSCICNNIVFSQTAEINSVDAVAGNFIKQLQKNDQEKIFIHTSKWYYTAGETIWLKAYCINAFSHKPSTGSKTMFVELMSDQDSVVQTLFLHIF